MFLEYTLQENPSRGGLNGNNNGTGLGIPRKMPIVELIKLLIRARYEKHFPPKKKAILLAAGQKCGLIGEQGQRTSKYYALMNDEIEQLARELTGQSKRSERSCPCGCGRTVKGKAKYASSGCRKRVSRWTEPKEVGDVTLKPNFGL